MRNNNTEQEVIQQAINSLRAIHDSRIESAGFIGRESDMRFLMFITEAVDVLKKTQTIC